MDLMAGFPREHRLTHIIFDYPSVILAIIVAYVAFVVKIGPDFMRHRKPYNLRMVARIYNIFQVLANLRFIYGALYMVWKYRHSGRLRVPCMAPTTEQPDLAGEGDNEYAASLCTFYLCVRILDLLDTVMFVLMKKQSHVSFLHVYHHVIAVLIGYVYLRSGWAPILGYGVGLNAGIHVIMYTYYFLATFPTMKPYLWWNRFLTIIQIIQFVTFGVFIVWLHLENCGYPNILLYYNIVHVCIFLVLFCKFYTNKYSKIQTTEADAKKSAPKTD